MNSIFVLSGNLVKRPNFILKNLQRTPPDTYYFDLISVAVRALQHHSNRRPAFCFC